MHSAEYYAHLKKAEEYQQKAASEPDLQVRRALETVAQEYLRRAEQRDPIGAAVGTTSEL
jgi:hypothetical protein